MLKRLINIAIIVSILLNIKSMILPMRNIQLPPFIDILLVRIQVYYFLITAFFIIPISFSYHRDKKREILIEIWFITTIMLIVKSVLDCIRTISWRY